MSDINEYTIPNMTCSSCAAKVSAAVNQVPGVVATDVDLAARILKVTGTEVEGQAVRTAIAGAGYQVD